MLLIIYKPASNTYLFWLEAAEKKKRKKDKEETEPKIKRESNKEKKKKQVLMSPYGLAKIDLLFLPRRSYYILRNFLGERVKSRFIEHCLMFH